MGIFYRGGNLKYQIIYDVHLRFYIKKITALDDLKGQPVMERREKKLWQIHWVEFHITVTKSEATQLPQEQKEPEHAGMQ